jgi:hypothetical protein
MPPRCHTDPIQAEIRIRGGEYKVINRIVAKIDGLAAVLTGDPAHFSNNRIGTI